MTLNPDHDENTEAAPAESLTSSAAPVENAEGQPIETAALLSNEDTGEDTDAASDVAFDESDEGEQESDSDVAVTYEGERPIVEELQYQQPRPKSGAPEEDEPADEAHFSSVSEARAVVEGFLFSSNEPLSVSRLSKLMANLHPKTVRGLLLELQWEYDNKPGALQIIEIAGGYQMSTRPFVAPWMFRLHKLKRRSPLSPATLETLAIIAYRQPMTKGEVEGIRGVETGAPLRTLQELGLIEASGRREVPGRPQLYITSDQFLKVFGLKSIADLPSISELKSRFSDEQKLKPKTTDAKPSVVTESAEAQPKPDAEQVQEPEDARSDLPEEPETEIEPDTEMETEKAIELPESD